MVYAQLLKDDFDRLAPALRKLHKPGASIRARGTVTVRHHSRLLAALAGFPKAGDKIPLELAVTNGPDGETWIRTFAGSARQSLQSCRDGVMLERMGPMCLKLRVYADGEDLRLESQGARFWRLPMPVRVRAYERGRGADGWEFEVEVAGVGSYRGVMELLA